MPDVSQVIKVDMKSRLSPKPFQGLLEGQSDLSLYSMYKLLQSLTIENYDLFAKGQANVFL